MRMVLPTGSSTPNRICATVVPIMQTFAADSTSSSLKMVPASHGAVVVGLLPAATSTAIGSQVQRPLAMVVVGGMLLVPILISWVLPVILSVLLPRDANRTPPDDVVMTGVAP